MVPKTLRCCGESSLPEQRSALRSINTLNPPKRYICKLGGLSPIRSTHWRGAPGLMWGARGPFLPAAAMVVAVVMPDVFCAKATEKRNKNTKISCLIPKSLFITICCKTYLEFLYCYRITRGIRTSQHKGLARKPDHRYSVFPISLKFLHMYVI
jgi:hypothetical protein